MLLKLLVYYWRESCNIRTFAYIVFILLLTGFVESMVWHDEDGEAQLFSPMPVSLVSAADDPAAAVLVRQLDAIEVISEVYADDLATARARLERHEIIMMIELPADFAAPGSKGQKDIRIQFNDQMPSEANLIARMLNQALGSLSTVQATLQAYQQLLRPLLDDDQLYGRYLDAAALEMAFSVLRRTELIPLDQSVRHKQFWFVVSSLISLFAMLPALLVLLMVQLERQSGRHERFLLARVPWWALHLAKTLIGLMWLSLALLPLSLIVRQMLPQLSWQVLFLAVVPLYLTAALFCITLAYRSNRTEAVMLTAWLVFLAAMLVGGAIYPYQLMPQWLLSSMPFSPVNWSFNLLYSTLYGYPLPFAGLIRFAGVLVAGTAASYFSWRTAS